MNVQNPEEIHWVSASNSTSYAFTALLLVCILGCEYGDEFANCSVIAASPDDGENCVAFSDQCCETCRT